MTVIVFRKIAQSSSMFQLIDHYPFGFKIQIYNIIFLYSILIKSVLHLAYGYNFRKLQLTHLFIVIRPRQYQPENEAA